MGTYSNEKPSKLSKLSKPRKTRKAGWIMLTMLSLILSGVCGCSRAKIVQEGQMDEAVSSELEESKQTELEVEETDKDKTVTTGEEQTEETIASAETPEEKTTNTKDEVDQKEKTGETKESTGAKIPYSKLENCIYIWEDEEQKELLQGYVSLVNNEESKNYKYKNSDLVILEAKSSYPSIEDQNNGKLQKALEDENKRQKEKFEKQVAEALEWAESNVQGIDSTNQELNPIGPYTFDLSWQVIRNDDKMLTIVYSLYSYAGGAHPNLFKSVVSFRTDTGERIEVKSITDDAKTVKKIIVQELITFVEENKCEPYLFGNEVYKEVFEQWDTNWWVQNGILFVGFNTYDIAPYVAGPLVIPVSLSKIETYLNPYGKSLQE
ncbi:DUF3298 and DUF4163 domain-containing protein [Anaerosporobacter faecicola]|uniref:DUF3298 and DUF4163 domain-containing protein n=1 Tax=Anaerosporobacter faecicola TaxID=2718714 RepID=UPI00143C8194|nr:DUF3298 and DUF4163 domain-containing protein [Anaerosporobacter faecicola]